MPYIFKIMYTKAHILRQLLPGITTAIIIFGLINVRSADSVEIPQIAAAKQHTMKPDSLPRLTKSASGTTISSYRRRALLIAVQYPVNKAKSKADAWPALHTLPDVMAIRGELIRRFHYAPNDITMLTTEAETTHANIIRAFKKMTAATEPGDTVYFHYSGHGGEVPNDGSLTGDQDVGSEPDGYDKTLIPSDYGHKDYYASTTPRIGGKPVCNEIRDFELKKLLMALAARRPRDVFLTFDCCHAGGNTRGASEPYIRGDVWHGPAPQRSAVDMPKYDTSHGLESPKIADVPTGMFPGYVVLAATNSDQFDQETYDDDGSRMGSLSYALSKAMDRATSTTTYRDMMSEVSTIMSVRVQGQTPQIEGPINRTVFEGTAVPTLPTMEVGVDKSSQPVLQAGFLQGLTKGSRVALRFVDATVDTKPIATATLKTVSSLTSTLTFDSTKAGDLPVDKIVSALLGSKPDATKKGRAPRAIIAELIGIHYPTEPLIVRVAPELSPGGSESLVKMIGRLNDEGIATIAAPSTTKWDVQILTSRAAARMLPLSRDGKPITILPSDPNPLVLAWQPGGFTEPSHPKGAPATVDDVEVALRGEAQRRLFNAIDSTSPGYHTDPYYNVEFRFVPVETETVTIDDVTRIIFSKDKVQPINSIQPTQFTDGDHAVLEVRNIGRRPAYITILNLWGNGKIAPVFPYPGIDADTRITTIHFATPASHRPWIRLQRTDGSPYLFSFTNRDKNDMPFPTSSDVYKIFVTGTKADYHLLIDTDTIRRGDNVVGEDTPLGRLIRSVSQNERGSLNSVPPSSGYTVRTVSFEIMPALTKATVP